MSKKTLWIVFIISLVFNITFIASAFVKMHRFNHNPQVIEKEQIRASRKKLYKKNPQIFKQLKSQMKEQVKCNDKLWLSFFNELQQEKPDYAKIDTICKEMSDNSLIFERMMRNKFILIRKEFTLGEFNEYIKPKVKGIEERLVRKGCRVGKRHKNQKKYYECDLLHH